MSNFRKFYRNIRNNTAKRSVVINILLLIFVLLSVSIYIYKNDATKKNINLVTEAEALISKGNYDSALNILEEINENKDTLLINKINSYKSVINDYKSLEMDLSLSKVKLSLETFLKNSEETLDLKLFGNMKRELNSSLDSTLSQISKFEEERTLILMLVEKNNLEDAEIDLRELSANFPKEDLSDINKVIKDKKEILLKEKEEAEKQQQTNNENINNQNSSNSPRIANTYAAQNSSQLITVVNTGGSNAELTLWQKDSNGSWYEYNSMFARLGSAGMKYSSHVREMDMSTPTGSYSLTEAFGIHPNPGSGIPYRVLDGSEYWVDDPESSYYNTMQFGDPANRWSSAEHLISLGTPYNYALVIDYNRWPVIPYASSAIFLHVDIGVPTWGCVAVSEGEMIKILQWLNLSQNPRILLDFSYDAIYNNY